MTPRGEVFAVFGFQTTHDAMRAEHVLEDASIDVTLIPTPKSLGTLCGLAARVPLVRESAAAEALDAARVVIRGRVEIEDRVGT